MAATPYSAFAKEAIDVGRTHPDEVMRESAMRIDPRRDILRICAAQGRGSVRPTRKVETEACFRSDTDAASRNVTEQDRAGRLTWTNDAHTHASACKLRPTGTVFGD